MLKWYKTKNESFFDVIRKLAANKSNIMKFAGALSISDKEAKEIKSIIEKLRKGSIERT